MQDEWSQVAHLSTMHDCVRFNCALATPSNPDPNHSRLDDGILVNLATFHAFDLLETLRPPREETRFGQKEAERASSNLKALVEKTDANGRIKIVRPTKKQLAKLKTTRGKGNGKRNEKPKETVEKVEVNEAEEDAEEEEEDAGEFEVVSDEEQDSRKERNRRYNVSVSPFPRYTCEIADRLGAMEWTQPAFEDDLDSEDSDVEEEVVNSDSKPATRKAKKQDEVTVILRALESKGVAANQQAETNSEDEEITDEEEEMPRRSARTRKQSVRLQESVASSKLAREQEQDAKKGKKS